MLVQSNTASIESPAQTSTRLLEHAMFAEVNLANSDVSVAKAAISDARAQQQL